jgi:uncharacterized damage-inducible protein DinB
MLNKSNIVAAEYYYTYINKVDEPDVIKALKKNHKQFLKFLDKIPGKKIDYAYAEGKWTIKQLVQHIIDTERVFAYRLLTTSRKDEAQLPGFDENNWAAMAVVTNRKWKDMMAEFDAVRTSTVLLLEALNDDALLFTGTASNKPVNGIALAYIMAGHVMHHIQVMQQRYLSKN